MEHENLKTETASLCKKVYEALHSDYHILTDIKRNGINVLLKKVLKNGTIEEEDFSNKLTLLYDENKHILTDTTEYGASYLEDEINNFNGALEMEIDEDEINSVII